MNHNRLNLFPPHHEQRHLSPLFHSGVINIACSASSSHCSEEKFLNPQQPIFGRIWLKQS